VKSPEVIGRVARLQYGNTSSSIKSRGAIFLAVRIFEGLAVS